MSMSVVATILVLTFAHGAVTAAVLWGLMGQ